jgi:hypothetical protein
LVLRLSDCGDPCWVDAGGSSANGLRRLVELGWPAAGPVVDEVEDDEDDEGFRLKSRT